MVGTQRNTLTPDLDWAIRRSPRACRICRKKKIRCDGAEPACAQCRAHHSECIYLPRAVRSSKPNHQTRKRSPPNPRLGSPATETQGSGSPSSVGLGSASGSASTGNGNGNANANATAFHPHSHQDHPGAPYDSLNHNHNHSPRHSRVTTETREPSAVPSQTFQQFLLPQNLDDLDYDALLFLDNEALRFPGQSPMFGSGPSHNGDLSMAKASDNFHNGTGISTPVMLSDEFLFPHDESNPMETQECPKIPPFPELPASSTEKPGPMAHVDSHDFAPDTNIPPTRPSPPSSANGDADGDGDDDRDMDSGYFGDELTEQDIGHSIQVAASGHIKYMGPSMSFPPGSQLGQQWITKATGSTYLAEQMRIFLSKWNPDNTESIIEASQLYREDHLPSYSVALKYVDAYFRAVQCAFPILDRQPFMTRFETTYYGLKPAKDPTWCALVNVVLAIGSRASPGSNEEQTYHLFENALGRFSHVILGPSCLCKVQVLILMYLFLSQTATPHWGYIILAAAAREAQALGMHLRLPADCHFSRSETQQRSLIFWSLYCLDTQLVYRMGRSPLLRRSEISLKLTFEDTDSSTWRGRNELSSQSQTSLTSLNHDKNQEQLFFYNVKMCDFAQRAHELVSGDLSLEALEQSVVELENEIFQFSDSVKQEWILDPTSDMFKLLLIPEPIQFPVALLNTSIYSVRSHLRLRVFSLKAARSLLGTHEPCDPREESLSITRDLIRASEPSASLIKLVSVLPKDSVNFFWYFQPLSAYAFNILFLAILDRPGDPKSHEFMDLMSIVIESTVNSVTAPNALMADLHLTHFLTFFARAARMAIQGAKANRNTSTSQA